MLKRSCFSIIFILLRTVLSHSSGLEFDRPSCEYMRNNSAVYCMIQGSDGFIWFGGSKDGLGRYDGDRVKWYKIFKTDSGHVFDNFVLTICEDRQGYLWIGTQSGGLVKFDKRKEAFTYFKYDPANPKSLGGLLVQKVYEDRRGWIWVGTLGGGLCRLDKSSGEFMRYPYKKGGKRSTNTTLIRTIFEDHLGDLWIGTQYGGLLKYTPETDSFIHFNHDPKNPHSISNDDIVAIYEDSRKVLWFGTGAGGLNKFDRKTNSFTSFQYDPEKPNSINNNFISAISEDADGNLWIGTWGGGINILNIQTGTFSHHRHNPQRPSSIGNDFINFILKDRNDVMWFGLRGAPLNKYTPARRRFEHFQHRVNDKNSLGNNSISDIYEDRKGKIWVATDNGLNIFDQKELVFEHINRSKNGLQSGYILDICEDSDGATFWLGSDIGLIKYHRKHNTFKLFKNTYDTHWRSNVIESVYQDKKGFIWLGTWQGVYKFDPYQAKFVPISKGRKNGFALNLGRAKSIFENPTLAEPLIWFTSGMGIYAFNFNNTRISAYTSQHHNSSNFIYHGYMDRNGVIWATTTKGLNKFIPSEKRFYHFLKNHIIRSLVEDQHGNLWLASDDGIIRFNKSNGRSYTFNAYDGVPCCNFTASCGCLSKFSPYIYFGASTGLIRFNPQKIKINTRIPPVYITAVSLFNKPITLSDSSNNILNEALPFTKKIELAYNQNYISFRFSALDFTIPEKNKKKSIRLYIGGSG